MDTTLEEFVSHSEWRQVALYLHNPRKSSMVGCRPKYTNLKKFYDISQNQHARTGKFSVAEANKEMFGKNGWSIVPLLTATGELIQFKIDWHLDQVKKQEFIRAVDESVV